MNQIIILISCIVFYFIGYYSGRYNEVKQLAKNAKRKLYPTKGTVINYITPEQEKYNGTEQEKIDAQQAKLINESGII